MGNFRIIFGSHMILALGGFFRFCMNGSGVRRKNTKMICRGNRENQIYSWGPRLKIRDCKVVFKMLIFMAHIVLSTFSARFNSKSHRFSPSRVFICDNNLRKESQRGEEKKSFPVVVENFNDFSIEALISHYKMWIKLRSNDPIGWQL